MQPKKGLLISLCVVFLCETVMFHDDRLIAVFSLAKHRKGKDDVSKVDAFVWLDLISSRLWDWIVRDSICAQLDQSSRNPDDSENNTSMKTNGNIEFVL